nr:ABC transporter ATP-binding protein/permease [uncultured Cellulosilyticum sp.]
MFNSRLVKLVPQSMRFIVQTVLFQWVGLIFNIIATFATAFLIEGLFFGQLTNTSLFIGFGLIFLAIAVRFIANIKATRMSYLASSEVKDKLRSLIYNKLLDLGLHYNEEVSTSKVVQMASEGVEQIEIYFGRYLPQLFYSLLAPITLFIVLSFLNIKVAFILLVCVPLIPMSIIAVNKFAKKLFSKYWASYTGLGDHFLDNLGGLTTLKVYEADEYYNEQMNTDAEHFRKITMKVLTMQLNSITLMDLIAYGGAALGIICALIAFKNGNLTLSETVVFLLLTSEFFIPLRLLGSFFHVAMNGMAAAKNIFALIDLPPRDTTLESKPFKNGDIEISHLNFSYDETRQILKDVSLTIKENNFVAIVGESGCGKSTLVSLLMGFNKHFDGAMTIGGVPLNMINEKSFMENVCIVKHQNYLFQGSIRDNLLMGKKDATDAELLAVLKKVNLYDFVMSEGGLDFMLLENASNLSGGQAQRLALARSLVHDAKLYIFDEATSNIDSESEAIIYEVIKELAKTKTVILISHRLANVTECDEIFVLEKGVLVEHGTHSELLAQDNVYTNLFMSQKNLEDIFMGGEMYA